MSRIYSARSTQTKASINVAEPAKNNYKNRCIYLQGVPNTTLDQQLVNDSRNTTSARFLFMNPKTLKSTGEMRRKAWLLDSPARRTGSDGHARLRQEDCVGRPCRPGSTSGEAGRSRWRPEAVAQQATGATPCEGAAGG
jgi:hypothetical protein